MKISTGLIISYSQMNSGVTSINHPITFKEVYSIATSTFLSLIDNSHYAMVGYMSSGWSIASVTTTSVTRNGDTNGINLVRKLIVIGS